MHPFLRWLMNCPAPFFVSALCVLYMFSVVYIYDRLRIRYRVGGKSKRKSMKEEPPIVTLRRPSSSSSSSSSNPPLDEPSTKTWSSVASSLNVPLNLLLNLHQLYRRNYLQKYAPSYPTIKDDPYLPFNNDMLEAVLLGRFLKAMINENSKTPVQSAIERMDSVVAYRSAYRCDLFHATKNMGSKMFKTEHNPGAEMYFADSSSKDKNGMSYIVGRLQICNDEMLDPANHLRAAMFVIDRVACELINAGLKNGKVPRASYILDLTDLEARFQSEWGGTGFGGDIKKEHKKNKKVWKPVNSIPCGVEEHVGQKPHLPSHYSLQSGLPCLKEAMRMLTTYYPELLETIYFYNPPWWFHPIFGIFSMWAKKDTRRKFGFVKKGSGSEKFWTIDAEQLSEDFGGRGVTNGGDQFVKRAIEKYDSQVT